MPANLAGQGYSFLGMTDPAVGYAVTFGSSGRETLLRTTDGGQSWAGVAF